jgi:hypothetical protein
MASSSYRALQYNKLSQFLCVCPLPLLTCNKNICNIAKYLRMYETCNVVVLCSPIDSVIILVFGNRIITNFRATVLLTNKYRCRDRSILLLLIH